VELLYDEWRRIFTTRSILIANSHEPISFTIHPNHPQRVLDRIGEELLLELKVGEEIWDDYLMVHFTQKGQDSEKLLSAGPK
jgi:hypothetical protein